MVANVSRYELLHRTNGGKLCLAFIPLVDSKVASATESAMNKYAQSVANFIPSKEPLPRLRLKMRNRKTRSMQRRVNDIIAQAQSRDQDFYMLLLLRYIAFRPNNVNWDIILRARHETLDFLYTLWHSTYLLPFFIDRIKARATIADKLHSSGLPKPGNTVMKAPNICGLLRQSVGLFGRWSYGLIKLCPLERTDLRYLPTR